MAQSRSGRFSWGWFLLLIVSTFIFWVVPYQWPVSEVDVQVTESVTDTLGSDSEELEEAPLPPLAEDELTLQ